MKLEFICDSDNVRLSEELKAHVSRKLYKNIKSSGCIIYVNDMPLETYKIINKGDRISLEFNKEKEINWEIYPSNLDVRYEDMNYLVVFKRRGLLSIPTMGEPYSLYQEVLYYLKCKGEPLSVSILNRLDKQTMGLVVIAKNRLAASYLQPTHMHMIRKYICKTEGIWEEKCGTIKNYIDHKEGEFKRFVGEEGKLAISHYRVLREYENSSLLEFVLETGRTHQIRVHTSHLKHPIIGDDLYGNGNGELMLLSYYVEFENPFTKERINVCLEDKEIYERIE